MDPVILSRPGAQFFTSPEARTILEQEVLPKYVPECRWFGGKARDPQVFKVEEMLPFSGEDNDARIVLVRVEYASGEPEVYALPILVGTPNLDAPFAVIATFSDELALLDALEDAGRRTELLRAIRTQSEIGGEFGKLKGIRGSIFEAESKLEENSRYFRVEQSNSSVIYGETIFLKIFRKPDNGLNPDVEITQFLSERANFQHGVPFYGALEYLRDGAEPRVLALATGMVGNRGDAWSYALDEVGQYFGRLPDDKSHPEQSVADGLLGDCAGRIAQLGHRTGEVHMALISDTEDAAFKPEPIAVEDMREISEGIRKSATEMFALLEKQQAEGEARELLDRLLSQRGEIDRRAGEIESREVHAAKTRAHGDYHLGQVLYTGDDFVIIDFEGEPRRTLKERQAKRSPLRDVAGMLRSFHYAAHSGLDRIPEADRYEAEPWAELWSAAAGRIFLDAWLETCKGAPFLPAERAEIDHLLNAYLLEKAIYEVLYELNHRPTWITIPVRGVLRIVQPDGAPREEEAVM